MGEALSRELVKLGWIVAMFDIKENKFLAEELGSRARFYHCNVADYDSQAKAFDQVFEDFGRINALCANAGIVDRGSPFILDKRGSDEIPPAPDLSCTVSHSPFAKILRVPELTVLDHIRISIGKELSTAPNWLYISCGRIDQLVVLL